MNPIFDSNIIIDFLNGHELAIDELNQYNLLRVSIITWIEVLSGVKTSKERKRADIFFQDFDIIPLNDDIAERAVQLRQTQRLKLPDAIILATAKAQNTLLITRDKKDFPIDDSSIRIPYSWH